MQIGETMILVLLVAYKANDRNKLQNALKGPGIVFIPAKTIREAKKLITRADVTICESTVERNCDGCVFVHEQHMKGKKVILLKLIEDKLPADFKAPVVLKDNGERYSKIKELISVKS